MKTPNFIYVGQGKSGTTWLFKNLEKHPEIFVTPVKETNFFDINFSKGLNWYSNFFKGAGNKKVIGEISHQYIHNHLTAERIFTKLGKIKIIIGLREPKSYFLSSYLFAKRNGRFKGSLKSYYENKFNKTFLNYKNMIEPYLQHFGRENIYIYDFDELKKDPLIFINSIFNFLGVRPVLDSEINHSIVNKASHARSKSIALIINKISKFLKKIGGQKIIAIVKKSQIIRKLLYKPLDNYPVLSNDIGSKIISSCEADIEWLINNAKLEFPKKWLGNEK